MLNWENRSWLPPRIGGVPNFREPRTDSERTDQIMRILGADSSQSSMNGPRRVGPLFAGPNSGRWAAPILGFNDGELVDLPDVGTEAPLRTGGQAMHMAAIPAAIPAGLQIGQAGIAALRALGPLAAATLAAIVKYFQDTLGRQPTPAELDRALAGQAQEQGSNVARDRPGTPEDKPECEDQLMIENAICDEVAKKYGRVEGKICGQTAMSRYSECLRFGPDGVRTSLYEP